MDNFASIILICIALIFFKNQTKPLVRLAKAAERFGKGNYVNDFRPELLRLEKLHMNLIDGKRIQTS